MTKPDISGIAPLFIFRSVPAALSFYRDRLGFDITFQGPEPDDIFFGIVERGAAMIMFKDVGVDPLPNYTRDSSKASPAGTPISMSPIRTRWRQNSCRATSSSLDPLTDTSDGLRGLELKDADGYVLFFGRPRARTPMDDTFDVMLRTAVYRHFTTTGKS